MATTTNEARLRLTAEDATGRALASAAQSLERLADRAERSQKRIRDAQSKTDQMAGRVAGALAGGLGGAETARFAKDSFLQYANFDRMLTRVGNTAGKTRDEMKGVGDRLQRMAMDMAMPVDQVAAGLDSLVSSGKTLEEAMDFLPAVAATAQASGAAITDISKSSDALALSFGFTGKTMQKAFDILNAGGKAGKFELKDMAQYLPQLAPMMAAFGYKGEEGLKQFVAMLQVVRKGTGDSAQAADALRDVLGKIVAPSTAEGFKNIGVNTFARDLEEAQKAGKNIPAWFLNYTRMALAARAASRGIAEPLQLIPQVFGDVQMQTGMRALLKVPGAVGELANQLGNVDGSVIKDLANTINDAKGETDRLAIAWGGVEKAIGKALEAAHVPQGLEWLAKRLEDATAGLGQMDRLGIGGASSRALARDEVANQEREMATRSQTSRTGVNRRKAAEHLEQIDKLAAGPNGNLYTRAQQAAREKLREADEALAKEEAYYRDRLNKARTAFERADTDVNQAKEGLPSVPEIPGALPLELTDPKAAAEDPKAARQDTLRNIERDTHDTKTLWQRLWGNTSANQPGANGFGGLIHKASITTDDGENGTGLQNGSGGLGGGGDSYSGSTGGGVGPRGGSGGMPNMRYGSGGRTPRAGGGGDGGGDGGAGGSQRRGGSSPADDGGAAEVAGAMNPRLAGSRKSLMDELDRDPALKRDVIKTASMENRGSPAKMQAVIESMVNRSKMNGYGSLRQAIHSGFYGPVNRGGLSGGLSEKDKQDGEVALKRVAGGSNSIGYRTDQGMLTDPGARRYMQEPDKSGHQVIGGENFFYMGQKGRAWAKQQEALDAKTPKPAEVAAASAPSLDQGGSGFKPRGAEAAKVADTGAISKAAEARALPAKASEAKAAEGTAPASPSMSEVSGPIHPDDITKLSPFKDAKEKPKRWVQDQETQKWKPDFKSDGSITPGLDQGGSGFKPAGDMDALRRQREELSRPIQVDISPRMQAPERIRERSQSQARREIDREVRNARGNTYSDVGVA
jgi:TP901 family phage tail tape measure protein